ncbi:hypothetical protein [Kitasatospora sp. NPDC004531]
MYDGDGEQTAGWTLHHRRGLRAFGDCDADLRDGPALTEWPAARGLTGSREIQPELARAAVAESPGADREVWSDRLGEAEVRLAAGLLELLPDATEGIRRTADVGRGGRAGRVVG